MDDRAKQHLIDEAAALWQAASDKGGDALPRLRDIAGFVTQVFENVPPDDLSGRTPEELSEAVQTLYGHARSRTPGTPNITIHTPKTRLANGQPAHTVVEIINDDMPFIVDSVSAALNQHGVTVHLIIHPILRVTRDDQGILTGVNGGTASDEEDIAESWVRIEIDQHTKAADVEAIRNRLVAVLDDVRAAVRDWKAMLDRVRGIVDDLIVAPPTLPQEDIAEAKAFLTWIADNHFTLLGCREYRFDFEGRKKTPKTMTLIEGSGRGLLREDDVPVFGAPAPDDGVPPRVKAFLASPQIVSVGKASIRSTVHRAVHLDAVTVKQFDDRGKVTGQHIFVGLFTSEVYTSSASEVPLIRLKIQRAIDKARFRPASHARKALEHIFLTYPRDELFQISLEDLTRIGMGILHLQERQRVALFERYDDFNSFVSCLVYAPRDRFNTALRESFTKILEEDFGGEVTAYYTQVSDDSVLARLHFIIKTDPDAARHSGIKATEAKLAEAGRNWNDKLQEALVNAHGEETGLALMRRYANAFGAGYCAENDCALAVVDIGHIEKALETDSLQMEMRRGDSDENGGFRIRIYNVGGPVPLSDTLPILEFMGLRVIDEAPHEVKPQDASSVSVHDFGVTVQSAETGDPMALRDLFEEAFAQVWRGDMEADRFNALVLTAGLDWRGVVVLRAYARYLRQAGVPYSIDYIQRALIGNAPLAACLVDLFRDRFVGNGAAQDQIIEDIEERLNAVSSLDEDRIIRRLVNLIQSTLRTNFCQKDENGGPKQWLSFKLDSQAITELPLPRPMVEIWVYSPRVEGVHLRFGKVARGGLRWSDRHEDFRTEILGLVKAQVVKNAVIVPVGSKGGFVVKHPPAGGDRAAMQQEGIACYKTFIRGMLDITDNIAGDSITPPADVRRYDEDDPYLVVAADKGTATFSDIANGISEDYGFWLGDAFASGGSAGYDHKKMGITARGAWEAVKRHFREMGVDTQATPFDVVGVGDMGGDVFGNGMLLSEHIRLVAAFNHLHIFVDPDPDPASTYAERKRLFDDVNGWDAYDTEILSEGGGVFSRAAKSIELSPQIKKRFGIDANAVTPNELIRAILGAETDLLWFGGIGTYIKATTEQDADVGDRANDAIRLNGVDIRAKVIGEGANLGVTQQGRIEFAQNGGRLNTDSIDNSAGVDCSDHEVNIKVLLRMAAERGDLTVKARNRLLERMTDEVAELVLRNNYLQSQQISVTETLGATSVGRLVRLMRTLEKEGVLNRAVEELPQDEVLEDRLSHGTGFTRPELAILSSYAKIDLFDRLLASDLPDDPYLLDDLVLYFPTPLRKTYHKDIEQHRLRREIIATQATNSIVNRAGSTFVRDAMSETGASAGDITRAYIMARESFDLRDVWANVQGMDNQIPAQQQYAVFLESGRLIQMAVPWFIKASSQPMDIARMVEAIQPGLRKFRKGLDKFLGEAAAERLDATCRDMTEAGFTPALARAVAEQPYLLSGCDIVLLSARHERPLNAVAKVYFEAGDRFGLDWLRRSARATMPRLHWDKLAVSAVIDDFYGHQSRIVEQALEDSATPAKALENWSNTRAQSVEQYAHLLTDIQASDDVDLAMLAVANRQLGALTTR